MAYPWATFDITRAQMTEHHLSAAELGEGEAARVLSWVPGKYGRGGAIVVRFHLKAVIFLLGV